MTHSKRPKFRYLGHSTVLCTFDDGRTMLIDPWVEHNPATPEDAKELERIDAMLITHGHGDHMGDAVALAKKHKPEIVVSTYEICAWLEAQGVENCSGMNIGGTQAVLDTRVTQVQAIHSSGLQDGDQFYDGGVASGFIVTLGEGPGSYTFYHAGDTALFSDMQLLADLYRPYLAFVPIGDHFTMDPRQAALACKFLEIREVVPVHWGTFPLLTGTPDQLEQELQALGSSCQVVALQPGAEY